jgi:cytochrome bd ubiquinol oxidase subunit I
MRDMDPLLYARAQMGLSLAFHIVFAAAGIALPALMVLSDVLHRRTGYDDYRLLSQRLAKGTAILFAVGAVSGTVLSFELGLLWPQFMGKFGELIGLPFALEGFAFFTEAIFLGIYLYGRNRVTPGLHLFSGVAVALSGAASAFFVTLVNAFMNNPAGFEYVNGTLSEWDPVAAMFSPSWKTQTVHVLLSCYQAIAFAMAGIHAFMLLKFPSRTFHQRALLLALGMATVTAIVQPISGDFSAKHLAEAQPLKFAALEAHTETRARAPLHLPGGLEIPGGLSFLAHMDVDAEVQGLNEFPKHEWPNVTATHLAFQVMVGCGLALLATGILCAFQAWRKRLFQSRPLLWLLVVVSPLGLVAMEAGWFVTELGRQPWIVRGVMRTAEAVTPFPHLAAPFGLFTLVYLLLGVVVVYLLWNLVAKTETEPQT